MRYNIKGDKRLRKTLQTKRYLPLYVRHVNQEKVYFGGRVVWSPAQIYQACKGTLAAMTSYCKVILSSIFKN